MSLQTSLPAASPEAPVHGAAHEAAPLVVPNGAPLPRASRLPRARRRGKLMWLVLSAGCALLLAGIAGIAGVVRRRARRG